MISKNVLVVGIPAPQALNWSLILAPVSQTKQI
jgi:hypothetical protein